MLPCELSDPPPPPKKRVYGAKCNFQCALYWKKQGRNVACKMLNIVLIRNIIKPAYIISACRPVERCDFFFLNFLTMHDQMQRRQLSDKGEGRSHGVEEKTAGTGGTNRKQMNKRQ